MRLPPVVPRPPRRGHTLIEPIVALTLLALGALGAAALLATAAHRLARSAQLAHTRDDAQARAMRLASAPCAVDLRGVRTLPFDWTDSATGQPHARAGGTPCP